MPPPLNHTPFPFPPGASLEEAVAILPELPSLIAELNAEASAAAADTGDRGEDELGRCANNNQNAVPQGLTRNPQFAFLSRRREHLHARALQIRAELSTHIHRETGPQRPTHSFWSSF